MKYRKKKVVYKDLKHRRSDRSTAPPNDKRKRRERKENAFSILTLSPEVLENILFNLSAKDVVSFGSTCHFFHELSLSQALWKRLYLRNFIGPVPTNEEINWKRFTFLKMSQGLVLQRLRRSVGSIGFHRQHARTHQPTGVQPFNIPMVLGIRRVVAIREQTLLWDYNGTIFVLFTPQGRASWSGHYNYSVLCHQAKDFAVDPHWNHNLRQYIYVLRMHESRSHSSESVGNPDSVPHAMCDIVDVFLWDTHQMTFRMTFHPTLCFTQLRLSGSEDRRCLLLLTDAGKVFSMHVNESQFQSLPTSTKEMTLKTICCQLPELPVKQLHTSPKSIVYITADGSVFAEVHTPGAYRQLFGTYEGFDPIDGEMILPLSLPYKVVKCSLGINHICLLDSCGRMFMQGSNHHGQLGTGDKIDRGEPTLVVMPMATVDVWCGLNHSLVLLEAECGDKQVKGCGCGSGGRLPGHLEGSSVFVRLNVQVPRTASSLCSSRECLYLICGYDITEPPARCYIPPEVRAQKDAEKERKEEDKKLHMDLNQIKRCVGPKRGIRMLQKAVNQHMTNLRPAHKAFLESALSIILQGRSRGAAAPQQQPDA